MGKCKCKHGKCKKHNPESSEKPQVLGKVHLVSVKKTSVSTQTTNSVTDSVWILGSPLFWAYGNRGENVNIGVIDTGIDMSHPVLQGKVVKRRDYVNDGASQTQFDSHATHVAGTICADSANLKGVAPGVKLYDYRVLDRTGSGTYEDVTQAIRDAVTDGCHIINMSLGGPSSYTPMHNAIKYAVNNGVLVVVAAGNEGAGQISYPGYYPEVVSVGAVEYSSSTGTLILPQTPWFSNTNNEVDVCSDGSLSNRKWFCDYVSRITGERKRTMEITLFIFKCSRNEHTNNDTYTNSDTNTYSNANTYTYSDSNTYSNTYTYSDSNTYSNTYSESESNTYSDTNTYSNANANTNT